MLRKTIPLLLFLALMVALGGGHVLAGDTQRGQIKARSCEECHDSSGYGRLPVIPHLAGLAEYYLIGQMKTFGKSWVGDTLRTWLKSRHYVIMDHRAAQLKDQDIRDLAAYYAGLPCRLPVALPKMAAPMLANRCISCHGPEGRSSNPTVPRIAGQHARYLENQLISMRGSDVPSKAGQTRRDRHFRIMDRQAVLVSDKEVRELARYFASRRCR